MPFVHDGIIHKDVPVPFYAGQMTKDNIEELISLFKIKGHADGAMQDIKLFLQKYNHMKGRKGWDSLAALTTCCRVNCSTSWLFTSSVIPRWVP
jgi:hypothetical protein